MSACSRLYAGVAAQDQRVERGHVGLRSCDLSRTESAILNRELGHSSCAIRGACRSNFLFGPFSGSHMAWSGYGLSAPFPGDDLRSKSAISLHGQTVRSNSFWEIGCDCGNDTVAVAMHKIGNHP